jgi:hypothetical protein
MMHELIAAGYVTRSRQSGSRGRFCGYAYTVTPTTSSTVVRFSDDGLPDDGLPDDGKPHAIIEDSIEKKQKEKKHTYLPTSAHEDESEDSDPGPTTAVEAAAEKEKSSALDVAIAQAAQRTGWQAPPEAPTRWEGPTLEEVVAADRTRRTPEELTEAVMAEIQTERGQSALRVSARRAGPGGVDLQAAGLNIYAAVYACCQRMSAEPGVEPMAVIRKLPGYLEIEADRACKRTARSAASERKATGYRQRQTAGSGKPTARHRLRDNPANYDYSKISGWGQ